MNIKLAKNYTKILNPIQTVLQNRNIENTENFFKHDWKSVQLPNALNNIEIAANKLIHHLKTSKTIAILVDSDCDGFTSAAVLTNYIRSVQATGEVGKNCTWDGNKPELKFLFHQGKVHGLDDTKVMKDLRDLVKPALLIIPDASGTDEQYKALNDIGIDIIVLDHHQTSNKGNNESIIVVNNQHSENYLNKDLSGVGVVYQFCCVLDSLLPVDFAENWIDLVAVGLVADVMDLRSEETRFLVIEGLKPSNIHNPFLKQAQKDLAFSLGGDYNPINVGFYIGPLFNAVTRIGTVEEQEILFRSLLDDEGISLIESGKRGAKGTQVPLVEEALRQATNVKSRQKRRQDKLTEYIDEVILEENLLENKVIIITIDDFDADQRALSGLIANKIQDLYNRPCILLYANDDGTCSGSVRAPSDIEAFADFRQQCQDSKLCVYQSGHGQAFGIKVTNNNIQKLQEYFNERYAAIDVTPTYNCDFIISADDPFLEDVITELSQYKHIWGQGIAEPLIAITDVEIGPGNTSLLSANKNPTIKITLNTGIAIMKFRSSKEEFDSLIIPYDDSGMEQAYKTTIVGRASVNEWNGNITPQIITENYEVHGVGYVF